MKFSPHSPLLSPATFVAGIALLPTIDMVTEATPLTRNFKRGLPMHTAESCNALTEHDTSSWWYSWGTKSGFERGFCDDPESAESAARNAGMEFIPMFWSHVPSFSNGRMEDDEIHSNLEQSQYLLTFNEPDLEAQANLSGEEAAEMWPTIEAIAAAYNVEIIAPCVTQDHGVTWYEEWLSACNSLYGRDCEFDYTCIHMYYQPYTADPSERCDSSDHEWACIQQGSTQGPTRAANKINQWATNYPGKQIWVTEYACAPWGSTNGCSAQEHTDVMNQLTPLLEESPDVFRYSWFGVYGGEGGTGDWDGSGLNENVWTYHSGDRGLGCEDRVWVTAFGNAGWQIQTNQQCAERADDNPNCETPLSLSIDDDACYCARKNTECNLVPAWPAMSTWVESAPRDSSALSTIGELYETFFPPNPTNNPTTSPTAAPTSSPTSAPTSSPTAAPTATPTSSPTSAPTNNPTASPTAAPTSSPTSAPTASPTADPTSSPTSGQTDAPTCYDYSDILPLDIDKKCTGRSLFLEIREKFMETRDAPGSEHCRSGLSGEIMALTGTTTTGEAHATFDSWCETHMEDWDTPYSRVGPPTVCYDYSDVLKLEHDKCNGRALFLHIRKLFLQYERDPSFEHCDGGLERELMALTRTIDVDDGHEALHDMCFNALQEASTQADSLGWGQLQTVGGIELEEYFLGAGFLNDETGNFQQEDNDFTKRGGYEKFIYIGDDPRRNDHYRTTEESYKGGQEIGKLYQDHLSYKFLTPPMTTGFQEGSCSSSNAAVCCWHRDRQYFDNNGDCRETDCANEDPGDNTDLCWTEDENGTIFPYPGDETEKDLHCHGFAWAQGELAPGDINAKAKWNNLFFVSLYDHLYQRGYADSITDEPLISGTQAMCGCVEEMNPVARADCTEAVGRVKYEASQLEEGGAFTVRYVPGTFSLKFQACQGYDYVEDFGPEEYAEFGNEDLTSSNNDLSAFVFRQYLEGKLSEDHVMEIEKTLIGYRDPSVNDGDEERELACQAAFAEKYPDLEWAEREITEAR